MCPEQSGGDDLNARSDRFSFGTVFLSDGGERLSFEGKTAAVIFDAILKRERECVSDVSFGIGDRAIFSTSPWERCFKPNFPSTIYPLGKAHEVCQKTL
jgi:hypothetical protein